VSPIDPRGAPVSIFGVGHWLLGIDRIGPRVLELLAGRHGSEVELCDVGAGGLALLDHLRGQELVIVVDACLLGGAPGEIHRLEPEGLELSGTGGSVHQIGPLEALAVARQLYPDQLPRRTVVLAVETEGLEPDGEAEACRRVLEMIDRELARWRSGSG
jgi:hydrogenase maturation protease